VRGREKRRWEADYEKFGSNGSSWVTFVSTRIILSLIVLQIYSCNNAKHINKYKWDMMSGIQ
jgi:hypothetical protein